MYMIYLNEGGHQVTDEGEEGGVGAAVVDDGRTCQWGARFLYHTNSLKNNHYL